MKNTDIGFQGLLAEMKERFEKVQRTLDDAGDIIADDIVSFITLYLAATKKAEPEVYKVIIRTIGKIDIDFKEASE